MGERGEETKRDKAKCNHNQSKPKAKLKSKKKEPKKINEILKEEEVKV
jgi:hypothetical protein